MAGYILRLYTDVLTEKAALGAPLPGGNRGIYVAAGMATIRDENGGATLSANSAWFSTGDYRGRRRCPSVALRTGGFGHAGR
jgi:hypothetical protein